MADAGQEIWVRWQEQHEAKVSVAHVGLAIEAALAINRTDPIFTRKRVMHMIALPKVPDDEDEAAPGSFGP